jgi:hypothetical protein
VPDCLCHFWKQHSVPVADAQVLEPAGQSKPTVKSLSFSASSVSGAATRFGLQIGMIPRCEQSLAPHRVLRPSSAMDHAVTAAICSHATACFARLALQGSPFALKLFASRAFARWCIAGSGRNLTSRASPEILSLLGE